MKGMFIDFYDSFSANIIQLFYEMGLRLDYSAWSGKTLKNLNVGDYDFYILGPGPGHVNDYQQLSDLVDSILLASKKVVGFCLGHQILGVKHGYELEQLAKPLHAKKATVILNDRFSSPEGRFDAQFYNSWYVKPGVKPLLEQSICDVHDVAMVVALRGHYFMSYQFHPESVGTTCPEAIFRNIKDFLYNNGDENKSKN